ncbi:ROK family protein [Streptomyces sp. ACA25]|uniref:ROK family protein n=1 Tax=Streptomyces sp. ACA25 TaxID=3022596 RepID=UPI002307227A|nr:ROK family protein [Streptomyces sp. ACA25]MDB1089316.1 ROK family protein [Streptomyces sp. ACA25]
MTSDLVAAVDIGGTKIAGALVDGTGALLERLQLPTPAGEPSDHVLRTVADVLGRLAAGPHWGRVTAVGIGSAGPVDARAGTVSPVNIPGWREFPLLREVRPFTGRLPVTLIGDGAAIAAAEHWRGAARGRDNVLCMVVSTGVGGGLILDGALRSGPTGNAGHIGHISVDYNGEPCPCGSRGCVERIASGTGIARYAREAGWRPAEPGGDATAAGVAEAALRGEPVAVAAFDRAARALAAGIAATATLVEIEAVVIGGGVSQSGEVLFGPLRRALKEFATLAFVRDIEVVPAELGTGAGLVGAAAACRSASGTFPAPVPAGN